MMRTLYAADIPQIMVIENTVHIAPWTEETFRACLHANYPGWVIDFNKKIIGFVLIAQNPQECHVLNICVAREFQRIGWGQKLLQHVLTQAKQVGVGIAYLEVRRSNSRAISLYKKMSFQLIGERKDYYPTVTGKEDALIYARSLT